MEKLKYTRVEECCEILDSMRIPITASDRKEGKYPYYGANGIQDYVNDYIFDDELVLLAEDGVNLDISLYLLVLFLFLLWEFQMESRLAILQCE